MKSKNIIIALITLTIMAQGVFAADFVSGVSAGSKDDTASEQGDMIDNLEEFADGEFNIFEPAKVLPESKSKEEQDNREHTMPLFKKYRIKATNYIREKKYLREQEQLKKEAAKNKAKKIEFFEEDDENEEITQENNIEKSPDVIELKGGVKEQVASTDVQLDSDNIDFDSETMDIIATGSPVLYFPPQKTRIKAKKMVYNHASNILKAYENVEVDRNGNKILGDYLEINMNEENAFMDNVNTKSAFLRLTARDAKMDDKQLVLYNGKLVSEDSYRLNLRTSGINNADFNNMIIPEDQMSSINDWVGKDNNKFDIKTKEIIIDAKKNTNTVTFKNAQINYAGADLFKIRSFTAHTNKNNEYFEANYPEFGSRSRIGSYIGPGITFDTPIQDGSTVKVIPIFNMRSMSNIGIGALAKYRSGTNFTEFGYTTSYDTFILRGRQKLDDKLYFQYGMNSYMDEWFLGQRMAKYDVEATYHDKTTIKSTIGENLNFNFRHRVGLGFMKDNDYNRSDENFVPTTMSTMRLRYMAQGSQELFKYRNEEKRTALGVNLVMQGSAAVYGSGDTQMIGRIGPQINTQYKRWVQSITYLATAYDDHTPMRMYDAFRFGHSSLHIREGLRLNKYLTIIWAGTVNLTNDASNHEIFQENAFILSIGPDDFKFRIGYDWFRQQTYADFVMSVNTKGSVVHYDKMVIKNPDRLAKNDKEKVELKVFGQVEDTNTATKTKSAAKMMYAEVRDIEDPDRESI